MPFAFQNANYASLLPLYICTHNLPRHIMTDTTTTQRDHHSGLVGFPVVWSRDFAYADRGPVALLPFMPEERVDINAISARDFAEYVRFPVSRSRVGLWHTFWA